MSSLNSFSILGRWRINKTTHWENWTFVQFKSKSRMYLLAKGASTCNILMLIDLTLENMRVKMVLRQQYENVQANSLLWMKLPLELFVKMIQKKYKKLKWSSTCFERFTDGKKREAFNGGWYTGWGLWCWLLKKIQNYLKVNWAFHSYSISQFFTRLLSNDHNCVRFNGKHMF